MSEINQPPPYECIPTTPSLLITTTNLAVDKPSAVDMPPRSPTPVSPARRDQHRYFSTMPFQDLPELENVPVQGKRELIPRTWNIHRTSHIVSDKLNSLVLEAAVSAGKYIKATEKLMEIFTARLPALCPQLRTDKTTQLTTKKARFNFWSPRTKPISRDESYVFIDEPTFSKHADLFFREAAVVKELGSDLQLQMDKVSGELRNLRASSPHGKAVESVSGWWDERITESEKWISLLAWVKERMTVLSSLEQLAEMHHEFGLLTVCEAPHGRVPLYELHRSQVIQPRPRGFPRRAQ